MNDEATTPGAQRMPRSTPPTMPAPTSTPSPTLTSTSPSPSPPPPTTTTLTTSSKKGPGRPLSVPLSRIDRGSNVRTDIDPTELKALAATIREHGLIQPVTLRAKGDRYELLVGFRRFAAHELLAETHPQFASIDALVVAVDDDVLAAGLDVKQLIENVARENLSPLDTASAIAKYVEGTDEAPVADAERKLRIEGIASVFGWSSRTVKKHLAFHHAPAWFRELGRQVKIPKRREGPDGAPVLDEKSGKPVIDVLKRPPLSSSFIEKLLALLNEATEFDKRAQEKDGSTKPKARAVVERVAFACAEQEWSIQRLEREIAAAKAKLHGETASTSTTTETAPKAYTATEARLVLDVKHRDALTAQDRAIIAAQAQALLTALGFSSVVIRP